MPAGAFGLLFAGFAAGGGARVALLAALAGAVGAPASLLVHEFGHVRSARSVETVEPRAISLVWLGAATRLEGAYTSGRDQARVAGGGPAASLALAAGFVLLEFLPLPLLAKSVVLGLALLNVAIALLSLLPIAPLDGHKLLVAGLWMLLGSEERARTVLRRLALAGLAGEILGSALLLAERPLAGAAATAVVGTLLLERRAISARARGRTRSSPARAGR